MPTGMFSFHEYRILYSSIESITSIIYRWCQTTAPKSYFAFSRFLTESFFSCQKYRIIIGQPPPGEGLPCPMYVPKSNP